jgi:cell fate (sporulation/competence/biofilm development) regulator YmcA (YheA/YmcA/DUF963 family)
MDLKSRPYAKKWMANLKTKNSGTMSVKIYPRNDRQICNNSQFLNAVNAVKSLMNLMR